MDKNNIQKMLFSNNKANLIDFINKNASEEELYIIINNYNWDDGFEVPEAVLKNTNCSLSVALLIFYLADGIIYLYDKESNSNLPNWSVFISSLYNQILNNSFSKGSVAFKNELSRLEKHKLSKILTDNEKIFLEDIDGTDCNIVF